MPPQPGWPYPTPASDLGLAIMPTLQAFAPRFLDGHARANRQKPSGIAATTAILRLYRAIQELAGHADLTMTQHYMHLSPAALDAAIRLLDRPSSDQKFGDGVETGPSAQKRSRNMGG